MNGYFSVLTSIPKCFAICLSEYITLKGTLISWTNVDNPYCKSSLEYRLFHFAYNTLPAQKIQLGISTDIF